MTLIRQWRIPLGRWTWEIPAGGVEAGEQTSEAAVREFVEETGLRPGAVSPLIRFANAPGHSTQWTTIVQVTGGTPVARTITGSEAGTSSAHLVPLAEVDALVRDGLVIDAKSLLALASIRDRPDLVGGSSSAE